MARRRSHVWCTLPMEAAVEQAPRACRPEFRRNAPRANEPATAALTAGRVIGGRLMAEMHQLGNPCARRRAPREVTPVRARNARAGAMRPCLAASAQPGVARVTFGTHFWTFPGENLSDGAGTLAAESTHIVASDPSNTTSRGSDLSASSVALTRNRPFGSVRAWGFWPRSSVQPIALRNRDLNEKPRRRTGPGRRA